eukprot:Gregarina_sp_Pseudo_9__790@NODE_1504_length_1539_cov_10_255333_g1394_i0_p1_GENE_NODE_1504_length_1539_cov_10_255333_g1394_i0NODE_1504_length_1539_cov_10_255333_g1394_i0_p1_ORF_typecomplete_len487_score73_40mRNA_cap_enzyme/PF01331_19/1_7e08DNA_ligase_A_M/PF01068_21/5_1e03DNA_ligase_A_M/PF01068_21/0_053_NODE_1504_length_1539_cov_10_255333_g1394_i0531513
MGKRKASDDAVWALSQISKKIRLSFEASREYRQRELADGLRSAIVDDEEFELYDKQTAGPSPERPATSVTTTCTKTTPSDLPSSFQDEDMEEEPSIVNKKKKKPRLSTWRSRMSQLIGTYDAFLDVPEDLFDGHTWNARGRPDGNRCLLIRNRRDNVYIVGKGGQELWTMRSAMNKEAVSLMHMWQILETIPDNTVLEGVWNADQRIFFVFDLLIWNSMEMVSCDFQARHFFLKSKWEEFLMRANSAEDLEELPVRLLLLVPISLTMMNLKNLYEYVARCNGLATSPLRQQTEIYKVNTLIDIIPPCSIDYSFIKYDGIVFTHNSSIYTPNINPFTLHWRNSDVSIWITGAYKRHPKGCLIFSSGTGFFKTSDGTECQLVGCVLPEAFTSKVDHSKRRDFIVRLSYTRVDLFDKPSGETIIRLSGVKLESWKLESEARTSWRWNGADSLCRLVLGMPLYDQCGNKVDTATPNLDEVIKRLADIDAL